MPVSESTVLVLGAGASVDYGFPLGVQLRNLVCRGLQNGAAKSVLQDLGHSERDITQFVDELRYSGHRSVDAFLERNPEFMVIGKRAIAAVLLPFETEDRLFPPGAPTDSWYEFLADRMGIGTDRWPENRLAVVTFNYDRSFEHYFSRVIAQRTRVELDVAFSCFASVPMVHVHGTLGDYPSEGPNGPRYGATLAADTVDRAAQRILVVSEVEDTLPTFDQAHELLRNARRVMFLGFGFHSDNVRRLRFFDLPLPDDHKVEVTGTASGFTDRDWKAVRDTVLRGRWSGDPHRGGVMEFLVHRAGLA